MRRAFVFLVWFTFAGISLVPLWFSLLKVERAALPDLEGVAVMPKRSLVPVQVHELALNVPWDDPGRADELMKGETRDGVFFGGSGSSLVVFGSRKQAWVRGSKEDAIAFAVNAMSAQPFLSSVVVPVSSRYSLTLSVFSADDQIPPDWNPACSGLEDLVEVLSRHLQLRVSSQVRYFVDQSMIHPHHWSADVTANALERPIDLVLYYRANATKFPEPFVIAGAAGVVFDWKTASSVWREQLKELLGFPRLTLAVEAHFAPCVIPEWELELWSRGVSNRLEASARKTLASLPKLLSSISGMPVTREMSAKLEIAVQKLESEVTSFRGSSFFQLFVLFSLVFLGKLQKRVSSTKEVFR